MEINLDPIDLGNSLDKWYFGNGKCIQCTDKREVAAARMIEEIFHGT